MLNQPPPSVYFFDRNGAKNMATYFTANEFAHVMWIIQPANIKAVPTVCHLYIVSWFAGGPFIPLEFTDRKAEQCEKPTDY